MILSLLITCLPKRSIFRRRASLNIVKLLGADITFCAWCLSTFLHHLNFDMTTRLLLYYMSSHLVNHLDFSCRLGFLPLCLITPKYEIRTPWGRLSLLVTFRYCIRGNIDLLWKTAPESTTTILRPSASNTEQLNRRLQLCILPGAG
jgi:hypothetical protein